MHTAVCSPEVLKDFSLQYDSNGKGVSCNVNGQPWNFRQLVSKGGRQDVAMAVNVIPERRRTPPRRWLSKEHAISLVINHSLEDKFVGASDPATETPAPPVVKPASVAPAHSMPSHSMPSHSMPSHSMPSHSMPSHSMPPHSMPSHNMPAHSMPSHNMPTHSMPSHSMPTHGLAAHGMPSRPTHSMPTHNMPTQSMPTQSMPTQSSAVHGMFTHGLPPPGHSENHSLGSAHWDRRPIFTKRVGQRRASSLYPQARNRPPLKPAVTPEGRPIVTFESESEEIQPSCGLSCRPATPKERPSRPSRPPLAPPRTDHPSRRTLCCDCGVRMEDPSRREGANSRRESAPQNELREAYTASVPAPLDRPPVAAPVAPVATYYRAPPEYVHAPPTYHREPAAYHCEEFRGPRRQSSAESALIGNGRRRTESRSPEPWSPEPRWTPANEFPRRETQSWESRPLIETGHTRAGMEDRPTELVTRRIIHRPGPWVEEQPLTYGHTSVQHNLESYSPSLHRYGVVDMAENSQEMPLREIRTQPAPRDEPPPIAVLSPETESVDRPVTSGTALKVPKRTAKPASKNAPTSRQPARTPREEPYERPTERKRPAEPRERPAAPRERQPEPRERQSEPRERQSEPRERQSEPRERQSEPRERQAEPHERQEYRVETGNHTFKVVRL